MDTFLPRSTDHSPVAANSDGAAPPAAVPAEAPVHPLRSHARSTINQLAGDAARIARGGVDVARRQAASLRDSGSEYIRLRPLQAVLVAAGAGALLMLLASLQRRRGGTRD